MSCRVLTPTGKELRVEVDPNWLVPKIKEHIKEQEGIPLVQQHLDHCGKQMYINHPPRSSAADTQMS